MNNKKNYKKGNRREIIKALYMNGSISYKSLRLFRGNTRLIQRTVQQMKQEEILSVIKKNGRKLISLKNYEGNRDKYESFMPKGYAEYYTEFAKKKAKKARTDRTQTERVLKNAECAIFMQTSGIASYLDEKIPILNPNVNLPEESSNYYNAKDIKEVESHQKGLEAYQVEVVQDKDGNRKILGSRMNGVLFSAGGIYVVYNINRNLIEWERYGEVKMSEHVKRIVKLKQKREKEPEIESILLADNMDVFERVINNEKKTWRNLTLLNIDFAYANMYGLPLDRNGQMMIKIMQRSGWQKEMMDDFLPEIEENTNYSVACDGYLDGRYLLLFCIPNISKLKMFLKRAVQEEDKRKWKVYCFDFQISLLARLGKNNITISSISLEEYAKEKGYV